MKGYYSTREGIAILFEKDVYLCGGARTPFGKLCGSLATVSPTDLGIIASREALRRSHIPPSEIHQVICANIGQSSADAYFLPRHIALYCGIPIGVPSLMVQRICASGIETIITAAEQIILGKGENILCCGTENMSLSPTASFGNRMGYPLGKPNFIDMLWEALHDSACGFYMGQTAENLARKYGITRQEADMFALSSFHKAGAAWSSGRFQREVIPISSTTIEREGLKPRKVSLNKAKSIDRDEHIRNTTLEELSKLPPVFDKNGIQTAGNSCGIVDGACAVVVSRNLPRGEEPRIRIVAASSSGVEPQYMGIGPVPAIKLILKITGLTINDISIIEINEAFAGQILACVKELDIPPEKLNPNGGAIAIGHPLAATGTRLVYTLSWELKLRKQKYGIASACIGGGQGTAILIENMDA